MALFDATWMNAYRAEWNAEPALRDALARSSFYADIGYGFPDEDGPRGYIRIEDGKCVEAGPYDGRPLDWDLRALEKNWNKWLSREIGMTGIGLAVTTGKLKFRKGDFKSMVADPRLATPFIRSLGAMGRVQARLERGG